MKNKVNMSKQHRYPWEVIETAIKIYYHWSNTYRSVSSILDSHGVEVSHKTIYEWVQKFSDKISPKNKKMASVQKFSELKIQESYVKCNGEWKYMYAASDKKGKVVSFVLRSKRNMSAARAFLKKNSSFTN